MFSDGADGCAGQYVRLSCGSWINVDYLFRHLYKFESLRNKPKLIISYSYRRFNLPNNDDSTPDELLSRPVHATKDRAVLSCISNYKITDSSEVVDGDASFVRCLADIIKNCGRKNTFDFIVRKLNRQIAVNDQAK